MRSYGDACRFASALDLIGERWALLVVRELLLGPKRFTELRTGLPGASPNILSERLRELEQGGVIRRRKLAPPASSWVYELTEWGADLEPVITGLGAWGARSPAPPASTRSAPTRSCSRWGRCSTPSGPATSRPSVSSAPTGSGSPPPSPAARSSSPAARAEAPALVLEGGAADLAALITGQLGLDAALESGAVRVEGSQAGGDPVPAPLPDARAVPGRGRSGRRAAVSGVATTV